MQEHCHIESHIESITETYLEWNTVPFSKYPSWCTSRMSPYLDFRWQINGLCRTSICTSASGSFPAPTATSREAQSQLSTASSMPPHRNGPGRGLNKFERRNSDARAACPLDVAVTFRQKLCCRKSFSGWFLFLEEESHAHSRPLSPVTDPSLISNLFISVIYELYSHAGRLYIVTLLNPRWRHSDVTEQFLHAAATIRGVVLAVVAVWLLFSVF